MLEKQIMIIGNSKMGKTRGILFPEVEEKIKEGKNLLILDSKEEYYPRFAKELKENGYTIKVCNFKNLKHSDGFDPLSYPYYLYHNGEMDDAIEMIKDFGKTLFQPDHKGDPFWENSASDFFTGLVLLLFKLAKKEEVHFASLANLLLACNSMEYTNLKEYIKTLDIMDPIYIATSPTLFAPPETRDSIIAVIKQALNNYFLRPTLLQSFQNEKIHLEQLKDTKTALFVISYSPLDSLTSTFISQVYKVIEKEDLDYVFVLDNLSDVRKLQSIEDILYTASYKKLQFYGVSKTDKMKEKYPPHVFENVEKIIKVEEKIKTEERTDSYPYPTLTEKPLSIFQIDKALKNK